MAHASTSAAAAAYAPSITNVNSQDGSLSHWLRRRRRRCSIALSLLVERGREGSEEVAPVAVVPRNGDSRIDREGARPRRGLPRSPLPSSSSSSSSLPSLLPPLACSLLPPPPPSSERSLSSSPFFSSHAEKGRSKEWGKEGRTGSVVERKGAAQQLVMVVVGRAVRLSVRPL